MQYEFIPRILSGAAELEIDFYRDLYELGVWWALLSGHSRTPAPHAFLAALPQAQALQAAPRREHPQGDGARTPDSRKARSSGLFRMRQIHPHEVVQMNTQATERFLMKRDFAHDTSPGLKTPSYLHSLAPETFDPDYERMRKEFDEVFAF